MGGWLVGWLVDEQSGAACAIMCCRVAYPSQLTSQLPIPTAHQVANMEVLLGQRDSELRALRAALAEREQQLVAAGGQTAPWPSSHTRMHTHGGRLICRVEAA